MDVDKYLGRFGDEGPLKAPANGGLLRKEALMRELATVAPTRLSDSLDSRSFESLKGLLAKRHLAVVGHILRSAQASGGGRIVLDSDGTNYLMLGESSATNASEQSRSGPVQRGRILPGGAIHGEVVQALTRLYVAHPAIVDAWNILAQHGIHVSIFSGRSPRDLRNTYSDALSRVPGFEVRAAKGRIVCEGENFRPSSTMTARLVGDPLGIASTKIAANLSAMLGQSYDQLDPTQFEERFGYRMSVQVAGGMTTLIRLHHRYRACMLAQEVGASVSHLDEPQRVDMTELSRWLFSDMAAAKQVLSQLREENSVITHAFSPLRAGGNLEVRDFIGHRSGCQDFSLTLPWRDVVTEISGNKPILLYAGDNFRDSGNDRPIMEAIRESNEKAKIIAVTHRRDDRAAVPRWMIGTSQFQLFLIQYLAARCLKGNNLG